MPSGVGITKECFDIAQKFVLGSEELPAIRLILGVSATPKRFHDLLQDKQHYHARTQHPVTVNPEDVTASGLLKDKIVLYHPTGDQPSDWSLLAAAARQWLKVRDKWNAYSLSQAIEAVKPIMVIQVADGNDRSISRTPLEQILAILEKEIGPLQDDDLAHSFQDDKPLFVGDRKIRKIDASRIQDDDKVKFVLFKMSLTTGWDCPRAEVISIWMPCLQIYNRHCKYASPIKYAQSPNNRYRRNKQRACNRLFE